VVSADAVEQLVRAAVEPYARRFVATAAVDGPDDRLAAVQAELQQVEERIRSLHRELRGELDADLWQELVVDLGRRRRELAAQRDALGAQSASACTGWSELTAAEQFEVMREALDAVVVRKARGRREPIADRTFLYGTGTVEHLLPAPTNGWALRPFDFAAADASAAVTQADAA